MTKPSTPPAAAGSVSFHVQKSPSTGDKYSDLNQPITYSQTITNSGGSMDLQSGIFTAPIAGIYYFAWTGLGRADNTQVLLMLNGKKILSGSLADSLNVPMKNHAIISLFKGDQVSAVLTSGMIYDDSFHYTNFIGILLTELLI